ncbi:MAG: cryptochrome/photolyase family protein, partial [Planctomycetota bacterium]
MNTGKDLLLVFPHQLFLDHPGLDGASAVCLIEDSLFFRDWYYSGPFHQQKIWLHRATMKRF